LLAKSITRFGAKPLLFYASVPLGCCWPAALQSADSDFGKTIVLLMTTLVNSSAQHRSQFWCLRAMSPLQLALQDAIFTSLSGESSLERSPDEHYECEMRLGFHDQKRFNARVDAVQWYGAFELLAKSDTYAVGGCDAPPECSAILRRRVERGAHYDSRGSFRTRHGDGERAERCRAVWKKKSELPPRDFLSARGAHVRLAVAREIRLREAECSGSRCSVGPDALLTERRSLRFERAPNWRVDFTRINDGEEYQIEIELCVRRALEHNRTANELAETGAFVLQRVQTALFNAARRHAALCADCIR